MDAMAKPKQPAHRNSARRPPPKDRQNRGKRNLYRAEYVERAKAMCDAGALEWEVAEAFSVDERTIRRWRRRYSNFNQAMTIGLSKANDRVEVSLYHQAIGYWIDDEEIRVIENKIVRIQKRTWVPPVVSAAIYWSKVKMGWREYDQPKAVIEGDQTPEGLGIKSEPMRQTARRLAFILHQGGKERANG